MFWPVFYAILWLLLSWLFKRYPPKVAALVLLVAVVAQVVDTSAGWWPLRRNMQLTGASWPSPLKSPFWQQVPENYHELRMVPPGNQEPNYQHFAYFAGTHGMATDAFYVARIDETKLQEARREAMAVVTHGARAQGTLYVLDRRLEHAARRSMRAEFDRLSWIDGFLVLAPGWKCRAQCASGQTRLDCSQHCASQ